MSRRLAYFCTRRLNLLLSDGSLGPGTGGHPAHGMLTQQGNALPPTPTSQPAGGNQPQTAFTDFYICPQHRPLVFGLSCMLQVQCVHFVKCRARLQILHLLIVVVVLCSLGPALAPSEHSVVLPQCSGVALLSDGQQEQNRFPSGPAAHRSVQFTNARRQHCLHTAGTCVFANF